jgi:outer membrane receptor for ferrienterochelin and colicins
MQLKNNIINVKEKIKFSTMLTNIALVSSVAFSSAAQAEGQHESEVALDTLTINSNSSSADRNRRMIKLKDDIVHTEVVDAGKIEKKQAGSLAQAIEDEPGVKVNTDCSMCGVKRVMLNGLKGEHTTIMINGVPNSSLMEGFYGFDAIPTAGVTSIEIARGAGASLLAPEAIGGVVNVVTARPSNDSLMFDVSAGNNEYHKYQMVGTKISHDKDTAFSLAAQSDHRGQIDVDNNNINESPELTNRAMTMQVWHKISETDRIDLRLEDQYSEVFGGPMVNSSLAVSKSDARTQTNGTDPGAADFLSGDVVSGKPSGATARDFLENIITTKQSYTAKWVHDVNQDMQTQVVGSYVDATLDSIYEGITYKADQDIYYVDARADYFSSDTNAITVGIDIKQDDYITVSTGGTGDAGDSYELQTNGFYVKDLWTPTSDLEVSAALRVDKIDVDFLEQDREFDETVVSPRMHVRYLHNFSWTSRLSLGQGYRVPLAFFETDHGIVDSPLEMAVTELEKSNSAQYSINYNAAQTEFTSTYSWTSVDHLAMINPNPPAGKTQIINSPDTGTVQHIDATVSHQFTGNLSLGTTVETFLYDENYRDTFGIIPAEERIKLMADYDGNDWEIGGTLSWIGSRDYSDYVNAGYDSHFKDRALTEQSSGNESPTFFTVDLKASMKIGGHKHWTIYTGVTNLLDYTQTGEGSSPLLYEDTDGSGTGAVNVTHIWGPLRGRELYAGIKAAF